MRAVTFGGVRQVDLVELDEPALEHHVDAAAGVHCEPHFAFSPGAAYDKNLTYRAGHRPAR